MKKINKNEITVIKREVSYLVDDAKKIEIKNEGDMTVATTLLSNLNGIAEKIDEEKQKVVKPLNEALSAERARWRPIETEHKEAIDNIRAKMSIFMTLSLKREQEEAERIAARVGAGKGKLSLETAVRKIGEIEKVVGKVVTSAGSVSFRTDKKLKIVDERLIPREFLVVDERLVLETLKAGKDVPGAEIELIQVPINVRK